MTSERGRRRRRARSTTSSARRSSSTTRRARGRWQQTRRRSARASSCWSSAPSTATPRRYGFVHHAAMGIGPRPVLQIRPDRTRSAGQCQWGGPNWRSPASPRPGTMNAESLRWSSIGRGDDVHRDAGLLQPGDALRRAQGTHRRDRRRRVPLDQQLDGVDERTARGQHRVDHDHRPPGERLGQLVHVRHRGERRLVPADPDEAHVGVRQQLLGGVYEPQPGAQDRHDHWLHLQPLGWRCREGRLHRTCRPSAATRWRGPTGASRSARGSGGTGRWASYGRGSGPARPRPAGGRPR